MTTFQVFIDNDLAYISDVIVNENIRRKGLAQAVALSAFRFLQITHPEIKDIWLIGGGEGVGLLNRFLNKNPLPLEEMTPAIGRELGLLPIFTQPKELLLKAGLKANQSSSNYIKNSLWAGAAITAIGAVTYATVATNNYLSKRG